MLAGFSRYMAEGGAVDAGRGIYSEEVKEPRKPE